MRITDFDYTLPRELIATQPLAQRDTSRLMVIDREKGTIDHKSFLDLPDLLPQGCVIIFNDSRVLKARLFGHIANCDKDIEVLLTKEITDSTWECLAKPGKKLKTDTSIEFGDDLSGVVISANEDGSKIINFTSTNFHKAVEDLGHTPLPPYIQGSQATDQQYQTVYAKTLGSVAAPTAGLHFTDRIFGELKKRGIGTHFVTLHVGRGTFEPVKTEVVTDHKMHSEWFTISKETAKALNTAKESGKKIVAVGTTSVRVLESCYDHCGRLKAQSGETDIFIYPGYKWKFVDHVITNFHLPKSTLFMLISAFAGKELVQKAYQTAIEEKYRFYSFGDSMLIL